MDGKDRRASLQLGRQARKEAASPYARPKASPASANASASASGAPSRLSGLLSYLSPFRRGKKKEPSPEPEPESDDEQDHNNDDDDDEPQHSDDSDDNDDAQHINAPVFELHGDFIEDHDVGHHQHGHEGDGGMLIIADAAVTSNLTQMDANAPPSPTPYQNIYPDLGSSITASKSMPQLASTLASNATPPPRGGFTSTLLRSATRADFAPVSASPASWGQAESVFGSERSPPGRANEELARFFREKADRGDEPLTAIEQAGVLHLMQQAKTENLPTAFTPNFRSASPAPSVQPFYARQDSVVPISPSATSNNSMFGDVGASASTSMSESTAGHTPYRRRRPIYVGAGYSSRSARRNRTSGSNGASNGSNLMRSQSEGRFLNSLGATNSTAEGKRRRVEAEDAPPVASTLNLSYSASPGPLTSVPPSPASSMTDNTRPSIFSRAKVTANAVSTPVRPSPLWQVSKADTPSPSPPKKVASATPRSTTRAADMMMDIIRQEDAARPDKTFLTITGREAFINPYESTDHNPLARIPRSRPVRPPTPLRPASARVAAQKVASAAPSPKKVSPLEQLERSMPAKYRCEDGNRSKAVSSVASTSPAPTPQKKAAQPTPAPMFAPPTKSAEVAKPSKKAGAPANPFAALASETEEAEDEDDEDGSHVEDEDEDEEEDEEEDEDEEESDDDIVIIEEVVKKPAPKSKTVFTPEAPAPKPSIPAPSVPASKPVDKPAPVVPMFGASSSNMFGNASSSPSRQPVTAEVAPTPKPAFSFSFGAAPAAYGEIPKAAAPKPIVPNGSSTALGDSDVRKQTFEAARSSLPTFVFAGTWNACTGRGEATEAAMRAAQDLAKMMSRGELPTFEF